MPSGVASGSGAGYHSPNSPIAPLPQRNDVVPWSVLTDLTKKTTKDGILPVFNDAQKGMDKTTQRIQGFMVPLDAKPTQTHFLLTSVPMTCSFCTPGGPESMVEVKAKTPVRYSMEPVVVRMSLLLASVKWPWLASDCVALTSDALRSAPATKRRLLPSPD